MLILVISIINRPTVLFACAQHVAIYKHHSMQQVIRVQVAKLLIILNDIIRLRKITF